MEDKERCPKCGKSLYYLNGGLSSNGKYRVEVNCMKGFGGCGWSGYAWFALLYMAKTTSSCPNAFDRNERIVKEHQQE